MSMMQPKLKSKVRCTDGEVGELRRVIMDPLSHEISDIVVGDEKTGSVERQIPMSQVQGVTDEVVTLRATRAEYATFPASRHDDVLDMMARILDEGLRVVWPAEDDDQDISASTTGHGSWMAA